eukprot:EG_transcript_16570
MYTPFASPAPAYYDAPPARRATTREAAALGAAAGLLGAAVVCALSSGGGGATALWAAPAALRPATATTILAGPALHVPPAKQYSMTPASPLSNGPVLEASGLAAEGPATFWWRLQMGSAVAVVAALVISAIRSVTTQNAVALAAHCGRWTNRTVLRAAVEEGVDELDVIGREKAERARKIAQLKAEEKFFRLGTGNSQCPNCTYTYLASKGDPAYPIAPGTAFSDLPEDWTCPVCSSPKSVFRLDGVEVAGFEVNQGYGFGTNSMTEEQKSLLIFGSLLFFFFLFLSGYFLE